MFVKHLAQVFTPNTNVHDDDVEAQSSIVPNIMTKITLFSPKEVQQDINNLNIRKASRFDSMTPIMLKKLPRKWLVPLTYTLNAIFRLKY